MAIKEYRVPQANLRPIYKKPVRLPRDYVQPSKAAAKETPEVPLAKGQAPIAAQGRSPRYDAGSLMGLVSSLRSPGEANPTFDPAKPIGGENVPYKGTSGIGGVFSRIFGNRANELNVEAQQTQAAEMRDKALREEERKARKEDLAEEIRLREEGPMKRFETEQKRLADKDIRDEIAREDALNLQLVREGEKDILDDVDMARREVRDAEERAFRERDFAAKKARDAAQQSLEERRVKLAEDVANKARYRTIPTEKGGATVIDELTGKPLRTYHPPSLGMVRDPKTGKEMPGTIPGRWEEYGEQPKLPANLRSGGGGQVDRATGATLGGPLPAPTTAPTTAAPKVTAPRSGLMNMIGAGAENVAGALGLDGITEIPAALGDLISRDPRAVEKAARSRARYLNPSMQRTY